MGEDKYLDRIERQLRKEGLKWATNLLLQEIEKFEDDDDVETLPVVFRWIDDDFELLITDSQYLTDHHGYWIAEEIDLRETKTMKKREKKEYIRGIVEHAIWEIVEQAAQEIY